MTSEEPLQRIVIDPAVCHGRPCVKGTRILVTGVLDALAAGLSAAEIVRHYPSIAEEDVQAAAAYGGCGLDRRASSRSQRSSEAATARKPQPI